jgi:DNA-binding response OmpR family regulator
MMNKRVLIVSYNPVIQKNLKKVLEFNGYSCSVFSPQEPQAFLNPLLPYTIPERGDDVDRKNASRRYDLGILDMGRPGRLSNEYFSLFKEKYPGLPIIILVDGAGTTWPLLESSIQIELAKPFKSWQILELIQHILPTADQRITAKG